MANADKAAARPKTRPSGNEHCPSCGAPRSETYCPRCGEKRIDRRDYSVRSFFLRSVQTLGNLDNRLLRTFRVLLLEPGLLTAVHLAGRRLAHIKPLQLFLITNFLYFIIQPLTIANTYNQDLNSHLNRQLYSPLVRQFVERQIDIDGPDFAVYQREFDAVSAQQARSLIVIMVPMLALVLHGLFGRQRRYFVEHLVFSLHLFAFSNFYLYIGFMGVLTLVVHLLHALHVDPQTIFNELTITLPMSIGFMIYIASAIRRVYDQGLALSLIKAGVLVVLLMVIAHIYRLILFFTTYYWLRF